jgi:hypothetical protein
MATANQRRPSGQILGNTFCRCWRKNYPKNSYKDRRASTTPDFLFPQHGKAKSAEIAIDTDSFLAHIKKRFIPN